MSSEVERSELEQLRHDLRSPLMIISGFAHLLAESQRELTPEERVDYSARIAAAATEIGRTIDEALG